MYRTRDSQPCQKQRLGWEGCKLCNLLVFQEPIFLITIEIHDMYVKIKLTDEPSWPMCILDLSKQPAKGTAQNTERLNVNGAACSLLLNVVRAIPNVLAASLALRPPWTARIAADILSSIIIDITRQQLSLKQNWSWKKRRKRTTPKACRSVFDERRSQRLFTFCGSPHACFVKLLEVCHELRSSAFLLPYFLWLFW